MRERSAFLAFLAGGWLATAAAADIVVLEADRDNTLYQSPTGNLSNGKGEHFFVGVTTSGRIRRGLVRFNIAGGVPTGATISAVRLELNMSRTNTVSPAVSIGLYRVMKHWGEGASNAFGEEGGGGGATPGDATWKHASFNTVFWANDGGDFNAAPSASQIVGDVGVYRWDSTAHTVADVQMWLDLPDSNAGWLLLGGEDDSATAKRFDSRENPSAAARPRLIVEYLPLSRDGATPVGPPAAQQLPPP